MQSVSYVFVCVCHFGLECCNRCVLFFFFQAEDGIRDLVRSRGLGDVYKRQQPDRHFGSADLRFLAFGFCLAFCSKGSF